jgi:hypothetical protein
VHQEAARDELINDRMDRTLYDRREKINSETSKDVLNDYPALSLDCQLIAEIEGREYHGEDQPVLYSRTGHKYSPSSAIQIMSENLGAHPPVVKNDSVHLFYCLSFSGNHVKNGSFSTRIPNASSRQLLDVAPPRQSRQLVMRHMSIE